MLINFLRFWKYIKADALKMSSSYEHQREAGREKIEIDVKLKI